jgi:hypothetical protein
MRKTTVKKSDRTTLERLELRASAARSNKVLNAKIKQHGGTAIFRSGKRVNTYATVAEMNNIAIKGKMAQVIQATEGVTQTRDAYSNSELARIEFQEMLEAQALEVRNVRGHAEILQTIDEVIADIDRLVKKYAGGTKKKSKRSK